MVGATNLNGLTDVTITTPSSGQVLKYDGSNWVNDTDATGGSGGISGVVVQEEGSDVELQRLLTLLEPE